MTKRFRIGIIGLGTIGRVLLEDFRNEPRAEIAAVCDSDDARAKKAAEELGDIPWSTDYRAMLAGNQVDLVYVAVPPKFHHPIVLEAIAAGRHILCEKPLALTLAQAREMTSAVRRAGLIHAMNLPLHYRAGARTFAREVRGGRLGDLRRVAMELVFPRWPRDSQMTPWVGGREQGGAVREVGPHLFHQLHRNFGPVRRVFARMEYPEDPVMAENGAVGLLELAGGQLATVNLLCNLPRPRLISLTAYGSAGTLGLYQWATPLAADGEDELAPITDPEPEPRGLIANLLDALEGKPADLCGFEVGLEVQRVLDAWERSAASETWADIAD